jgi:phosphatidylinositol 4-kinase B
MCLQLTSEFVDVMEGPRSATFRRFRELCVKTYMELRRQRHKIILLVEMFMNGNEGLACFGNKPQVRRSALAGPYGYHA